MDGMGHVASHGITHPTHASHGITHPTKGGHGGGATDVTTYKCSLPEELVAPACSASDSSTWAYRSSTPPPLPVCENFRHVLPALEAVRVECDGPTTEKAGSVGVLLSTPSPKAWNLNRNSSQCPRSTLPPSRRSRLFRTSTHPPWVLNPISTRYYAPPTPIPTLPMASPLKSAENNRQVALPNSVVSAGVLEPFRTQTFQRLKPQSVPFRGGGAPVDAAGAEAPDAALGALASLWVHGRPGSSLRSWQPQGQGPRSGLSPRRTTQRSHVAPVCLTLPVLTMTLKTSCLLQPSTARTLFSATSRGLQRHPVTRMQPER
jgi:hypothetical protein